MTFRGILKLVQAELYAKAKARLLPDIVKELNEHDIARLVEERVRSEGDAEAYTKILMWLVAYDDFKAAKPHHSAVRSRQENAREVADWFVKSWHEDPYERTQMTIGLTMTSPDQRIRAAMILFEVGEIPDE